MTSLVLFNSERSQADDVIKLGVDWGTSKKRTRANSDPYSSHGSGTYLYAGEPISQNYRNTDITLSNVRTNDELVPAPLHTTNISTYQIPLKFPSNHPFSSHISEKALFPNASFSLDDCPSTETDPYIVTHKIRGNPFRREVHYHGSQGQRQWPDKHYMQIPRSLSDLSSSSIYPWPRKMFAPNDDNLIPNTITNVVKNKGRTLLETTYQGDYSNGEGLGSHVVYDTTTTLSPTDKLKPHFNKTLDPARPIEGIQAMHIHGNHRQASALENQRTSIQYVPIETTRTMSENEKFDDHMRNGTDYINLPANMFQTDRAPTWIPRSEVSNNDNQPTERNEIRYLHHLRPTTIVSQISHDHQASHQQIAAENRLQQLQVIRPQDNVNLLNLKFHALQDSRHARPSLSQYHDAYVNTFYDQVGTYVQERSGLYHTDNYEPNALTQSMPELENHEGNDVLLKDEHNLSDLLNNAEQIQDKSKPELFQYKAFGDYQAMRNRLVNKFRVPQDSSTVDTRTQEGNKQFIQRESVYGQTYNTRNFLQENTLSHHARTNPSGLMSTKYNNDLERVRSINSFPKQLTRTQSLNDNNEEKSHDILIGPLLHPSPYDELYSTKYITEHTNGYSRRSTNRVYDSPFKAKEDMTVFKFYEKQQTPVQPYPMSAGQLTRSAKTVIRLPGPEIISRSIEPKLEAHSTYQRSFKGVSYHETVSPMQDSRNKNNHQRLSMKDNDIRFGRTSDGRVKQWKLIDLQDHWTKAKAQRQYHVDHPESVPYVGESTMRAKKEIVIADLLNRQRMTTVR